MKILLLTHIPKLGSKGDIIEVSSGYAKNALFPKKLATVVSPEMIKNWEQKKEKERKEKEERKEFIKRIIPELQKQIFEFKVKTGKNNEVFTSLHQDEIQKSLAQFLSTKNKLLGPEDIHIDIKPIKDLGEYTITIRLGREENIVKTNLIIKVISEK